MAARGDTGSLAAGEWDMVYAWVDREWAARRSGSIKMEHDTIGRGNGEKSKVVEMMMGAKKGWFLRRLKVCASVSGRIGSPTQTHGFIEFVRSDSWGARARDLAQPSDRAIADVELPSATMRIRFLDRSRCSVPSPPRRWEFGFLGTSALCPYILTRTVRADQKGGPPTV